MNEDVASITARIEGFYDEGPEYEITVVASFLLL